MDKKKPQKDKVNIKELKKIKIEDALVKILSTLTTQIKVGSQASTIKW